MFDRAQGRDRGIDPDAGRATSHRTQRQSGVGLAHLAQFRPAYWFGLQDYRQTGVAILLRNFLWRHGKWPVFQSEPGLQSAVLRDPVIQSAVLGHFGESQSGAGRLFDSWI